MALRWTVFLWASLAWAGDAGPSARIAGGTVTRLEGASSGHIDLTGDNALAFQGKKVALRIPWDRIHTLEYGQRVSRRYAEAIIISPVLLLSKSRKHFLTLGYTDEDGRRQAIVLQVSKHDIRAVLAGLEAKTGRRVEYQDQEARKSGKG